MLDILKRFKDSQPIKYLSIFHPYFFAIYPIAAALARNIYEVRFLKDAIRPLVIAILLAIILFYFLQMVLKPPDRAGLVSSLILLYLINYAYFFRLPESFNLFGLQIHRHIMILFFWILFISFAGSKWLWNRVRPKIITKYLNLLALISLLIPGWRFVQLAYLYAVDPLQTYQPDLPPISKTDGSPSNSDPKDIYYIILDGYGRQDILQAIYGHDNSTFINALKERGFYVAAQSRSNYNQTPLSLASSLNLEYLDFLSFAANLSDNLKPLTMLIEDNRVTRFLQEQGYTIIALESGYFHIDADVYYSYQNNNFSTFEAIILETTVFRVPFDLFGWRMPIPEFAFYREKILYSLNTLPEAARQKGPKFVYAHIMAPHPPFVFSAAGDPVTPDGPFIIGDGNYFLGTKEQYLEGYSEQVTYLNRLVLDTVDQILETNASEPIIIIQGDHGPGALLDWASVEKSCAIERTSILNAYYMPDQEKLYPSISPVNTFRIVFDSYFNTSLGTLPDQSYFSIWLKTYDFVDVTDKGLDDCKLTNNNPD